MIQIHFNGFSVLVDFRLEFLVASTEKAHDVLSGHYIVVSVTSGMTIISDMTTISGTVHTVWSMVLELPLKMPLQLKISTWTYPL